MCEYCDNVKKIAFSKVMSDEDKLKQIEEETNKEIFLNFLDANEDIGVSYESLGLTQEDFDKADKYELSDDDLSIGRESFKKKEGFKIEALYTYTSYAYGSSGYGENSRRFCKTLAQRMRGLNGKGGSMMRYRDILRLNGSNPGFGSGGSNSYSIFLYRGGSNCKHFWVKYYYDTDSQQLVKAPFGDQPLQIHKGDMPPPKK